MWALNAYSREINRIIWVMYTFNRVADKSVQLEKTQSLKPTEKIGDKSNVLLTLHLR